MKTIEEKSAAFYKRFFSGPANQENPLIGESNTLSLSDIPHRRL